MWRPPSRADWLTLAALLFLLAILPSLEGCWQERPAAPVVVHAPVPAAPPIPTPAPPTAPVVTPLSPPAPLPTAPTGPTPAQTQGARTALGTLDQIDAALQETMGALRADPERGQVTLAAYAATVQQVETEIRASWEKAGISPYAPPADGRHLSKALDAYERAGDALKRLHLFPGPQPWLDATAAQQEGRSERNAIAILYDLPRRP